MKIFKGMPTVRLVLAMLVIVAVIGLSALAIHAPTQSANPLALKGIQTDKATAFYAHNRRNAIWFVEAVLPVTDKKAAADSLKTLVATL